MIRLHKPISGRSSGAGIVASLGPAAWFRYNTGITVTGAGVSQWDDQSGNARHLKQGTDGNRPALQADGSILFDGVANYLKCDAFTLNSPVTTYILCRQTSYSLNDVLCDGNTVGTLRILQGASSGQLYIRINSTVQGGALDIGTYGVLSYVSNSAASAIQINLNAAIIGDTGLANPGGFTLGANGTPAAYSNIQVKEVIIFPAAHDASQRARCVRDLMGVGGVA